MNLQDLRVSKYLKQSKAGMKLVIILLSCFLFGGCVHKETKQTKHELTITQYAPDGKVINSWVSHKLGTVKKDLFCFELDDGNTMCVSQPYNINYKTWEE